MRGEQAERVNDVIEEVGQLVETLAHDEGVASLLGIPPHLRAPTAKELASELLPTEGKHRVLSLKPGLSRACLVEGTVDHLTQLKCLVVLLLLSCMTSQCRDEVRSCLLQRDVVCKQAAAPLAADAWTYIKCLVDCTVSSAAAFQAVYGEKADLVAGSGTVPAPLFFLRMALVRTGFTLRRTGTRPATFTPDVTKQVDCLAGGGWRAAAAQRQQAARFLHSLSLPQPSWSTQLVDDADCRRDGGARGQHWRRSVPVPAPRARGRRDDWPADGAVLRPRFPGQRNLQAEQGQGGRVPQ